MKDDVAQLILDRIEILRSDMATKDDIANIKKVMATKDDIANIKKVMATKDDIANMATKSDIDDIRKEMHSMEKNLKQEMHVLEYNIREDMDVMESRIRNDIDKSMAANSRDHIRMMEIAEDMANFVLKLSEQNDDNLEARLNRKLAN